MNPRDREYIRVQCETKRESDLTVQDIVDRHQQEYIAAVEECITKHNAEIIGMIEDDRLDINWSKSGKTALQLVCDSKYENFEIASILIEGAGGGDPSALQTCAINGHVRIVNKMCSCVGNERAYEAFIPFGVFSEAVKNGQHGVVEWCLDFQENSSSGRPDLLGICTPSRRPLNPLFLAIVHNHADILDRLLKFVGMKLAKNLDSELSNFLNEQGVGSFMFRGDKWFTDFLMAAAISHQPEVDFFQIEYPAGYNTQDHIRVVKVMLDHFKGYCFSRAQWESLVSDGGPCEVLELVLNYQHDRDELGGPYFMSLISPTSDDWDERDVDDFPSAPSIRLPTSMCICKPFNISMETFLENNAPVERLNIQFTLAGYAAAARRNEKSALLIDVQAHERTDSLFGGTDRGSYSNDRRTTPLIGAFAPPFTLSVVEISLMVMSGADLIEKNMTDGDINETLNRLNQTWNGVCLAEATTHEEHETYEEDHCAVLQVLLNRGLNVDECAFLLYQSCEKGFVEFTRMLLDSKGCLRRDGTYHGAVTIVNEVKSSEQGVWSDGCTPVMICAVRDLVTKKKVEQVTGKTPNRMTQFYQVLGLLYASGAERPDVDEVYSKYVEVIRAAEPSSDEDY
jgi:hypothetical protein